MSDAKELIVVIKIALLATIYSMICRHTCIWGANHSVKSLVQLIDMQMERVHLMEIFQNKQMTFGVVLFFHSNWFKRNYLSSHLHKISISISWA